MIGNGSPKVTVIVPNYNHEAFLEQRLRSVLAQTYTDLEVLYLDDASTDGSNAVARRFEKDPRLRLILNQTNSGSPFKQWNKGIREARGEYIWIAESDDYADPRLLETLVAELERNPQVGLAYCQSLVVDAENTTLFRLDKWTDELDAVRWQQNFVNRGRDECRDYLVVKNTIQNASAVVFRKKVYEAAGGADESYRTCADWLLWAKMLMGSDVAFVAQTFNYFRRHSASVIGQNHTSLVGPMESYRVMEEVQRLVRPTPRSDRMARDWQRWYWLGQIHGRTLDWKRWKQHAQIYRIARRVDKSINYWLFRRLLACAFLGK